MTTQPPRLSDRTALLRNRARAATDPVTFLQQAVILEVQERLTEVNRAFNSIAIVTGHPKLWQDAFPAANVVADEDMLSLGAGQFDLVVHAMALHWANDPVGQLVQCRHALKPDGLLLASFFGGQTLHELRTSLSEAEVSITGGLSPRVAPMGELRDLGALLQRAGLALPVADITPYHVSYAALNDLMRDLRGMGEANALSDRLRRPTRPNVFRKAQEIYQDHYPSEHGRLSATFEIVTLTGWAPSSDQQKPLRPGSAKARLAEALNTREVPIKRSDG